MGGEISADRPSAPEIRRALQECMTFADVDDAMGWPAGTARRRRWRPLERGGLPPADAELAGNPIWFRRTFETWHPVPPDLGDVVQLPAAAPAFTRRAAWDAPARHDAAETDPEALPAEPVLPVAPVGVAPDEVATPVRLRPDGGRPEPPGMTVPVEPLGTVQEDPPPGTSPAGLVMAMRDGEPVVAWIRGAWRSAVVMSRDRRTVMLEYRVDTGPLGTLQQRVGVAQVRVIGDRSRA